MLHENFHCELYFIRHGESKTNVESKYAAHMDFNSALTQTGQTQAKLLGKRLKKEKIHFDAIYSSSFIRTLETTEIMLENMDIPDQNFHVVHDIIEQQHPGWRGKLKKDINSSWDALDDKGMGMDYIPPGGESLKQVERRMATWIENEILTNSKYLNKNHPMKIAVIGHGQSLQALFHYIMGFDEKLIARFCLYNCSISRFIFNQRGWTIISINDSTHTNGHRPNPSINRLVF